MVKCIIKMDKPQQDECIGVWCGCCATKFIHGNEFLRYIFLEFNMFDIIFVLELCSVFDTEDQNRRL